MISKNKILEFYAENIWPFVRHFVPISKRCKKCILSEKFGPLKNGLCEFCSNPLSKENQSENEVTSELKHQLDATLRSAAQGDGYHAALLLSGGKDSAYILKRMRTEYPDLKILCLFIENGFSSPVALENARAVAEKTQTDLLIVNSHIERFKKAFRKAFLELNGRGSYGVIDYADGSLIFEIGSRKAQEFGIPLVIGGLSWVQVQIILGVRHFEIREEGQPKIIHPLYVWRTNEQEIKRFVKSEGLIPPGNESPIVSNNALILTMSAIDVLNLGYCSFEPEFAQLIREGKTDRKPWLHAFELLEFATLKGLLKKDISQALKKLDLTLEEVIRKD